MDQEGTGEEGKWLGSWLGSWLGNDATHQEIGVALSARRRALDLSAHLHIGRCRCKLTYRGTLLRRGCVWT